MRKKIIVFVSIFLICGGIVTGIIILNKKQINDQKTNSKSGKNIPSAKVVQYLTEADAIEGIKRIYGSDKSLRLKEEKKDYWVIEEIEEESVVQEYHVYKNKGIINRANVESPENYSQSITVGVRGTSD